MPYINKKQTYALINKDTGKIIKYCGKLQYFRVKQFAKIERDRLQRELGIKIELRKKDETLQI